MNFKMGVIAASILASGGASAVTAERWRIYITANNSHSNTSIAEIVFRDSAGSPISYAGGSASASSTFSGSFLAPNAFDGSNSSRWATAGGSAVPSWIEYDFAAPVTPETVDLRANATPSNDMVKDFQIEYWNGSTWISVISHTGETGWGSSEMRNFFIQDAP